MILENNIQAYPLQITNANGAIEVQYGMTLLDHFAGLAMQGYCANEYCEKQLRDSDTDNNTECKVKAEAAYQQAAAMLEARKQYIK